MICYWAFPGHFYLVMFIWSVDIRGIGINCPFRRLHLLPNYCVAEAVFQLGAKQI
jgi:hypothetical protein